MDDAIYDILKYMNFKDLNNLKGCRFKLPFLKNNINTHVDYYIRI